MNHYIDPPDSTSPRRGSRTAPPARSAASRRGDDRRRDHRCQRLLDRRRRDGVHGLASWRCGRGGRRRRLPAARRCSTRCSSTERGSISNGYSIILMALADERNRQLLERDLRYAVWVDHAVVDAAIGTFIEYGTKTAQRPRVVRRGVAPLDLRRLLPVLSRAAREVRPHVPPRPVEESWNRIWNKGYVTRARSSSRRLVRQLLADRRDGRHGLRVVRAQVPGSYDKYGRWWEEYGSSR